MQVYFRMKERFVKPHQATVHMQRYASLGGLLRADPDGRYTVLVPCGRRPLAVEKMLRQLDSNAQWRQVGVDDDLNEIALHGDGAYFDDEF